MSRVLKNYELGKAGLAGFEKIKLGFSWFFLAFQYIIIKKVYGGFLNLKIMSWV